MKRITASSQGHCCNAIVQKGLYCLKYILLLCRYYCTKRVVVVTSAIALLVAIFCSYYLYLDSLYLIDEILEGDLLRELAMKEKLTIRVLVPYSGLNDLSQFVLFHSICPSVHEIQILWHREESPPSDEYFKYTKTHSKVNFYRFNDMHLMDNMYGNVGVETESLLLLDADVFISCDDLSLALSSWRSSSDALLGFFPRIHKYRNGDATTISLEGWRQVLWGGTYSILLSSGLFVNPSHLQQSMKQSTLLRGYISSHPYCLDLAVPLSIIARNNRKPNKGVGVSAPSPVWVIAPSLSIRAGIILSDHPVWQPNSDGGNTDAITNTGHPTRYHNTSFNPSNRSRSLSSTEASSSSHDHHHHHHHHAPSNYRYLVASKGKLSYQLTSQCLTDLTKLLNISHYPTSSYKTTRASSHVLW